MGDGASLQRARGRRGSRSRDTIVARRAARVRDDARQLGLPAERVHLHHAARVPVGPLGRMSRGALLRRASRRYRPETGVPLPQAIPADPPGTQREQALAAEGAESSLPATHALRRLPGCPHRSHPPRSLEDAAFGDQPDGNAQVDALP